MKTFDVTITVTETKIFTVNAEDSAAARELAEEMDTENVEPVWSEITPRCFKIVRTADTPG